MKFIDDFIQAADRIFWNGTAAAHVVWLQFFNSDFHEAKVSDQ